VVSSSLPIFIGMTRKQYIDISGSKFGKLLVLEYTRTIDKRPHWKCSCDCGNVIEVRGKELKSGGIKSCGCLKTKYNTPLRNDLTNKKYNFLFVISREIDEKRGVRYKCLCDCGKSAVVSYDKIVSGHTKSCGCLHRKTARTRAIERNKEMVGENHPRWNGALTKDDRDRQIENRCGSDMKRVRWMNKVYNRDGFLCQKCKIKNAGKLCAHHVYSWNTHKSLRYVSLNGLTLCQGCHKEFHGKYGYGNNTRKQLTEWLNCININE
jgi:hypothetical protein